MTAETEITGAQVLCVPMQENDADAGTIREYLVALARNVWREGECFSGKRPFGNSCWQAEVYRALFEAELISGVKRDDYGWLEEADEVEGNRLIGLALVELSAAPPERTEGDDRPGVPA